MKNKDKQDKFYIDKKKLNRLKYSIFQRERENLKTKQLREYQMDEIIREIIERTVLD